MRTGYLLFRALCRLSMKQIPQGVLPDSVPVRSKLQALQLIKGVLEKAGAVFMNGDKFAYAIKQYLCLSLLKNCVSQFEYVYRISLEIFYHLIEHFIDHLKTELGVFFINIFFRFLEGSNASYNQKEIVLGILRKLCEQARFPVDLYLNYDCDFEGTNIFERLIESLSDLAKGNALQEAINETMVIIVSYAMILVTDFVDPINIQIKKMNGYFIIGIITCVAFVYIGIILVGLAVKAIKKVYDIY